MQTGDLQVEELIALSWRIERELASHTRLKLLFDLPPVFRGLHPQSTSTGMGLAHYASWQQRCGILTALSLTPGGEYALCGLAQGVQILRVHDVAETRQALEVWRAIAVDA